jgi:uncharacterized protein with PIN domain
MNPTIEFRQHHQEMFCYLISSLSQEDFDILLDTTLLYKAFRAHIHFCEKCNHRMQQHVVAMFDDQMTEGELSEIEKRMENSEPGIGQSQKTEERAVEMAFAALESMDAVEQNQLCSIASMYIIAVKGGAFGQKSCYFSKVAKVEQVRWLVRKAEIGESVWEHIVTCPECRGTYEPSLKELFETPSSVN